MRSLTEGWAIAYFSAAICILVFGVGIPALVLQASVPEDLRRLVSRYRRWPFLRRGLLITLGLASVALFFVWFFQPECSWCSAEEDLQRSLGAVVRRLGGSEDRAKLILANVVMTVAILGFVSIGGLPLFNFQEVTLRRLGSSARRRGAKRGGLDEGVLADIRYIGEKGRTEGDRIAVVGVLGQLAEAVVASSRYDGGALGHLIDANERIVRLEPSIDVFMAGMGVLEKIVLGQGQETLARSTDLGWVLRSVRRLASVSVGLGDMRAVKAVVDLMRMAERRRSVDDDGIALVFLDLGQAGLLHGHLMAAVEALTRLEVLAWRKSPLAGRVGWPYLALCAAFSQRGGALRAKALASLGEVEFADGLSGCLAAAQRICYDTGRFSLADALAEMPVSRQAVILPERVGIPG